MDASGLEVAEELVGVCLTWRLALSAAVELALHYDPEA